MFILEGGKPGDERGFIHKKILGVVGTVGGFIPGIGGTIKGITDVLGGIGGKKKMPATGGFTTVLGHTAAQCLVFERSGWSLANAPTKAACLVTFGKQIDAAKIKFAPNGGGTDCPRGMRRDFETGICEPGGGQPPGEAVMGQYGAGLLPGAMQINRSVCLRGMQLGNDGLCYNKSQITNKQRMWPAGRKPLLSGGDMRAISIAARAGRRLEGATKRLQRLGMMKKPTRRAGPTQHQRLLEAHVTK